ncbi:hypothetical protein H4W31_005305 [Plantactinospora soyae]|uniref:Uncharacterized protein n=1 Tax=Plantactinospora soyae TaxID=1544732 RepID=A0A927M7Y8_9ACTN|nr:hypothetical protein [Plantactinospora soyae]
MVSGSAIGTDPVLLLAPRWDPLKDVTGVLRAYAESSLIGADPTAHRLRIGPGIIGDLHHARALGSSRTGPGGQALISRPPRGLWGRNIGELPETRSVEKTQLYRSSTLSLGCSNG